MEDNRPTGTLIRTADRPRTIEAVSGAPGTGTETVDRSSPREPTPSSGASVLDSARLTEPLELTYSRLISIAAEPVQRAEQPGLTEPA